MIVNQSRHSFQLPSSVIDNIDLGQFTRWSVVVPEITTNIFPDPSFEYTVYNTPRRFFNATVVQSNAFATQGIYSMQITPFALANNGVSQGYGKKLLTYALSQDYTFSADVKASIGDKFTVKVQNWDILDEFSRSDNTSSVGYPDSVTTGGSPQWVNGAGTWGISSRKLYNTTDTTGDQAILDTGVKDAMTEMVVSGQVANNVGSGPGRYPGLCFRYNGTQGLMVHVTDNRVVLRTFVSTTPGSILASFTLPGTVVNGNEYLLSAVANGNVINFAASGACSGGTYASYNPMGQGTYTLTGGEPALYNIAGSTRIASFLIKVGSPTTPPARWDNFRQTSSLTGAPPSLAEKSFTLYTELQRLALHFVTPATLPPGLEFQILKTSGNNTQAWYTDAWQLENKAYPTSYIDGSLPGGQWSATVNNSPSSRLLNYPGGKEYFFDLDFNFIIKGVVGFGLPEPVHAATPYAVLNGSNYEETSIDSRVLVLAGQITASNQLEYHSKRQKLINALAFANADNFSAPVILRQQLINCGVPITAPLEMICTYSGGLPGQLSNPYMDDIALQFTEFQPPSIQEVGQNSASVYNVTTGITDVQLLYFYDQGKWTYNPAPGNLDLVNGMAYDQDGFLWLAGAGSVKKVNLATGTVDFSVLTTGAPSQVIISPTNVPIFVGNFTAPQTRIMQYDAASNSLVAVGAGGFNAIINDAIYDTAGNLMVVGDFTAPATRAAYWNGSAWAALFVAGGGNSQPLCIIRHPDGGFVIGGNTTFTTINGLTGVSIFKTTNPITGLGANSTLNGGSNGNIKCLAIGPQDGYIYAGGSFTTIGGVSANRIAKFNGSQWLPLGPGLNGSVQGIAFDPKGNLWCWGTQTGVGSGTNTTTRFLSIWDGSHWLPAPALFSSIASGYNRIIIQPNGKVTLGQNNGGGGGTHVLPTATTTVNYTGTADCYAAINFMNTSTSQASTLYSITNITTGKTLYFNLSVQPGETVTMTMQPSQFSMVSNYFGNVLGKILEGSDFTFSLVPGANVISTAGDGLGSLAIFLSYRNIHFSFDAAGYN